MDYPTAVAIALPVSTFIVICGNLIGKALHKNKANNSAPSVSRQVLNGVLNKKFEKVVYVDRCDAISKGIRNEMKLTREALKEGIEDIKKEIRNKANK